MIESRNASTAAAASRLDRFALEATLSTNSCFVTYLSSFGWLSQGKTLTGCPFRLNHAVLLHFSAAKRLSCPKRNQAGRAAREAVRSTLFAVDYADGSSALETGLAKGLDRGHGGPSGE